MSEITKLYENCNIKPKQEGYCDWDSNCPYPLLKCNDECPYWKDENEAKYPPFTAEKQLNLIILLANREIRISPTYISSGYYLNDFSKIKSSRNISTFENSLAQHINAIWQDLTSEEKQQVRGILEE